MCERKWPPKRPARRYTAPGQHEAPRGQEVQAPPPAVLVEDVVGPAGADRARGVLEERHGLVPSAVLVVPADRQLEERRREVVARLAPVEPRVHHQDHEPAERERQDARGHDPVGDPDPAGVTQRNARPPRLGQFFSHRGPLREHLARPLSPPRRPPRLSSFRQVAFRSKEEGRLASWAGPTVANPEGAWPSSKFRYVSPFPGGCP